MTDLQPVPRRALHYPDIPPHFQGNTFDRATGEPVVRHEYVCERWDTDDVRNHDRIPSGSWVHWFWFEPTDC